jgi:cytochrome c peroxidase
VRNSPGIFNLTWHPYFMHDGGVNHIEVQPLAPISNPIEMDEKIGNVVSKLQATAKYKELFKNAYGSDSVTSQRIFKAMAQFMGMMYSYNSKFDYYKRQQNNTQLNNAELRGYNLFISKCNSCHKEPLFTDFEFRSNGLPVNPVVKDSGRAHITGLPGDRYKFKTPSLRNIAKTGPYMHDGRFSSLEECLNHYSNGVSALTNTDASLLPAGIALSAQEKQDIISFLNTLTDFEFINDKRFADPNLK